MNIMSVYYLYSYSYYYDITLNNTSLPSPLFTSMPTPNITTNYTYQSINTSNIDYFYPTPIPTSIQIPTSQPLVPSTMPSNPITNIRRGNQISSSNRILPSLGYYILYLPLVWDFVMGYSMGSLGFL